MIKNYYKTLNIKLSSSQDEIKQAFRKLAIFWHPDKNSNPIAIEKMQEINEAYEILSNPVKRETYDKIYRELFYESSEITISKTANFEKQSEKEYKEREQKVREKYAKEIEELNKWIKNVSFSLSSVDSFLNNTIAKVDKPIENFVYYFPYVLAVIFIILIILTNVL